MTAPLESYLDGCTQILERVRGQAAQVRQAADWCAATILAGRMVHVFGSGHSRIMVEELWPRYGSFPGFNPIVELSLTFHNLVVGANGQRQAMFLENVPGLAERILRNYGLHSHDTGLIISSSGCNIVPIEMALGLQRVGIRTIGLVSLDHARATLSRHSSGRRLHEMCDLVLDTGAPPGDAMVWIEGLPVPVAPGSTVGGCLVVNSLKAEVAQRLTQAGQPPTVLTSAVHVGPEQADQLFEAAYDEHARRLARLYQSAGASGPEATPPQPDLS
jgi:uncharacterized phosphosugar-binding protein